MFFDTRNRFQVVLSQQNHHKSHFCHFCATRWQISKFLNLKYNGMIDVDLYVIIDEKSIPSDLKPIKLTQMPLLAIFVPLRWQKLTFGAYAIISCLVSIYMILMARNRFQVVLSQYKTYTRATLAIFVQCGWYLV